MPVLYLMYLSLQVSRNFSSWVGVIRSSWYRTFGCNVPERCEPTLKCGWMQSVSRADPTSLVPLSLMPYLSLVFLIPSEKLLTNFFISYSWGNWKLEGWGLRCCSSQPACQRMHLVKDKHLPLMLKTPPAGCDIKHGIDAEEREVFHYPVIECVITLWQPQVTIKLNRTRACVVTIPLSTSLSQCLLTPSQNRNNC